MRWAEMVNLLLVKIELITEDNQRWSTRPVYAKVNPENQSINKAFPHADTPKGLQLGWSGMFISRSA